MGRSKKVQRRGGDRFGIPPAGVVMKGGVRTKREREGMKKEKQDHWTKVEMGDAEGQASAKKREGRKQR